jgi:hypothetical protein
MVAAAATGCAVRRFEIPAGAGAPVDDYAAKWTRVAASCLGAKTLTAELSLSGRAGGTRLRGRVQAGFAPRALRLEGVAPFGQPIFILAAQAPQATLLLPRDERVVRAADAATILEALVGVPLDADALRAVVAGCAIAGTPTGAESHGTIVRFAFPDGAVFVDERGSAPRVVAAQIGSFLVEYPAVRETAGSFPRRVRISRDAPAGEGVDITIDISQLEANITLPAAAFTVDVPPETMPMTVDELRRAGPLGDGR